MTWPPCAGNLLPRATEAVGIHRKLLDYCLREDHPVGGSKARGFESILGISAASVSYLEEEIRLRLRVTAITAVRDNSPHGVNCVVEFPIRGIGSYAGRVATVRTVWLLSDENAPPRLVTAIPIA